MSSTIATWDEVVRFHGHSCMGLALGYRASEAALNALESSRDRDEEIVAIVENDSCAVDAVQFLTGCTFGKGNLFFHDYGKQVYTFALRNSNKAIRISVRGLDHNRYPELNKLRSRVLSGEAKEEEKIRFAQLSEAALKEYLSAPIDDLVDLKEVDIKLPEKARIFNSVICTSCGEKVMEPRARIKNGEIVCIPCADLYQR